MFYFYLHLPHLPVWQCMAHIVVRYGGGGGGIQQSILFHFISLHTFLWVPTGFPGLGSFSVEPQSFIGPEGLLQGLTDAVRLVLRRSRYR